MSTSLPIHEPLAYNQPIFDRAKHDRAKRLTGRPKHTPIMPRLKPQSAPIVTWRCCVGCGGDAKLCTDCARMEHEIVEQKSFGALEAVYRCCTCGIARAYGHRRPDDETARPALNCDGCSVTTRHRFLRVA